MRHAARALVVLGLLPLGPPAGGCPRLVTPAHEAFERLHPRDAERSLAAVIREGKPSARVLAVDVMDYVGPGDGSCLINIVRGSFGCGESIEELRGGNPDVAEALDLLLGQEHDAVDGADDDGGRGWALLLLAQFSDEGDIDRTVVIGLAEEALRDPDPVLRRDAVAALENVSADLDAIVWATRDPDAGVRAEACLALRWHPDVGMRHIGDILVALGDEDDTVRHEAAETIEYWDLEGQ